MTPNLPNAMLIPHQSHPRRPHSLVSLGSSSHLHVGLPLAAAFAGSASPRIFGTAMMQSAKAMATNSGSIFIPPQPLHSSTNPIPPSRVPFSIFSASHLNRLTCPSLTAPHAIIRRCGWNAVAVIGAFRAVFVVLHRLM